MPHDEVLERLSRIYSSFDAIVEGDLANFVPQVHQDDTHIAIYQDFIGGLNQAELSNLAHTVVHNIANLYDHLRRWAKKNARDPGRIVAARSGSSPLLIITDLSNNDKHGYPPRNGGLSGEAPRLASIRRDLRLSTGSGKGSGVALAFTGQGPKVSGSGSRNVVVTGEVVDFNGNTMGQLYDLELEALDAWERELTD